MSELAAITCVEVERIVDRRHPLLSQLLIPARFAQAVRAHSDIENSLHWVLDVTFDEDHARHRKNNGPKNLAILRRLTLNLLRTAHPKRSPLPANASSG